MILTVTLNPAIDHIMEIDSLRSGTINRIENTISMPGGKAINMASVLGMLGAEVVATGLIGGRHAAYIETTLRSNNVTTSFVYTDEEIRVDNYIIEQSKSENTLIIERGPYIKDRFLRGFLDNYQRILNNVDYVIIAGSLPRGVDISYVDELIEMAAARNCKVIINIKEEIISQLKNRANIFIVKPDVRDVCTYMGHSLKDPNKLKDIAENEVERGADYFIINCGDFNYIIATSNKYIEVTARKKPKDMKNSIALGDSFISGFLKALVIDGRSVEKSAEYALATAMATSRSIYNYPDSIAVIEKYLNNVNVRYLK